MARDRAGYPQPYTRNDLRADGRYVGELYERAFAYTLDGRRFGDEPVRHRAAGRYETRLPPKDSEFEIVARTLAGLGATGLAFETGERPDWMIRFHDGDIIGAEASEIDLAADFTNQRIGNREIRVVRSSCLDVCPKRGVTVTTLNEGVVETSVVRSLESALRPKAADATPK
jgi:hypothetical protein